MAQGLGRPREPGRRGRRPSALQREQRLRGRRRRRGPRPALQVRRRARDRADGSGARSCGGRQHGRTRRRLRWKSRDEHRRGLPPRRRVVRRLGRCEGRGLRRRQARPTRLSQAAVDRQSPERRHHPRSLERDLDDERRRHVEGPRAVAGGARALQGLPEKESVRHQAGLHRGEDRGPAASRNRFGPPGKGARRNPGGGMSPMLTKRAMTTATPPQPGAYAGKLLRVDLSKKKCWAEPWSPAEMRDYLGGAGLGAIILYRETATRGGKGNVAWDHPDNRLILATGPLAGLPVWGTGALTVVTIGAMTNGPTSTQANGFFGTNLKYCGYDAIVIQGQSKDWVYLYINDGVLELRDARSLLRLDTWETQAALNPDIGLAGHQLSVYAIGPAGENLVRFAAIHGDYGHVASKNGVGAVMGKKKLKAVAIVKGTGALKVADYRGTVQAADDIAHDLRTDPSAKSVYEHGTLARVVNPGKRGVLPIKNYTNNVPYDELTHWAAPALC